MQAFNWLLCNVIQTTSLHDILWHFVASLTPSPFEPEEEEDEDSKGNKDIMEQVWFILKNKRGLASEIEIDKMYFLKL